MKLNSKFWGLWIVFVMIGTLFAQGEDTWTANLTHSWTFDDGTPNDYVGGAHGTLIGGAIIADGSLLTYEGNQWMEMPGDKIAINTYDEITLEIWFVPLAEANTSWHMIVYFGDANESGQGVDYYFITPARADNVSRAAISCGVYTNPWTGESGANGTEYDDGNLHHMVSTLTNDEITLYIDGEFMASNTLAPNNSIDQISTTYAYLARGGYSGDPPWKGEILEFNIYNRALTPDEIRALYDRGPGPHVGVVQETASSIPTRYGLFQNYPNPFNMSTTIAFDLPKKSKVRLSVYDMSGREVVTLLNEIKAPGQYRVPFHAENLSSGLYLCRLETDTQILTRRMLLLK